MKSEWLSHVNAGGPLYSYSVGDSKYASDAGVSQSISSGKGSMGPSVSCGLRPSMREGSNMPWVAGKLARRSATLNSDSCCALLSWKEGLNNNVSTSGSREWSHWRECGSACIGIVHYRDW